MARKTNYRFEKMEREKKKALKKAEKAKKKSPDGELESAPGTPADPVADTNKSDQVEPAGIAAEPQPRPKLSLWSK